MPKTPVQSESTSNNRFNPYITKSISKTLLTPCRQIGLSRKRKTPNSFGKSLSDISVSNVSSDAPNLKTTPVTSRKITDESSSQEIKSLSNFSGKGKTKGKLVSKCLMVDKDDVSLAPLKSFDSSENIKKTNDSLVRDFSCDVTNDHNYHKNQCTTSKESPKKKDDKSKLVKQNTSGLEKSEKTDSCKNSMEKATPLPSTKNECITIPIKSKENILLTKTSLKNEGFITEKKSTKLKRSLSLKKSTDDINEKKTQTIKDSTECKVYLNPIEIAKPEDNVSESDINKLEKQVQEKKRLLENLNQAEIYRKLHDVDKLQELTVTWKRGCISALNALLTHLQTHADIDMAMLLNNLRVPKKLITLSQSGDLI